MGATTPRVMVTVVPSPGLLSAVMPGFGAIFTEIGFGLQQAGSDLKMLLEEQRRARDWANFDKLNAFMLRDIEQLTGGLWRFPTPATARNGRRP